MSDWPNWLPPQHPRVPVSSVTIGCDIAQECWDPESILIISVRSHGGIIFNVDGNILMENIITKFFDVDKL